VLRGAYGRIAIRTRERVWLFSRVPDQAVKLPPAVLVGVETLVLGFEVEAQ
jgi:hypothetical protein